MDDFFEDHAPIIRKLRSITRGRVVSMQDWPHRGQNGMRITLLRHLARVGNLDLRRVSEPTRQRLIELAMEEPPLVDVDADRVFLTAAGRSLIGR